MASERRRSTSGATAPHVPRPITDDDWAFLEKLDAPSSRRPLPTRIEPSYMALDTGSRRIVLALCILVLLALAGFATASLPERQERAAGGAPATMTASHAAHAPDHPMASHVAPRPRALVIRFA